jgi:hypothetical protein
MGTNNEFNAAMGVDLPNESLAKHEGTARGHGYLLARAHKPWADLIIARLGAEQTRLILSV